MTGQIPQSRSDLEAHLEEQLGFLDRSAEAFDAGFHSEAKRMATAIRVLVHDTGRSRSLLAQLGGKGTLFCDTSIAPEPGNLLPHASLAGISFGPAGVGHVARLDGDDPSWFRWVEFDTWWNTVVFKEECREMTRRGLVLSVADQDGGAHVDPTLNEMYARISRLNTLGRYGSSHTGVMVPLTRAELVSVRQIAHEILKTFKAGYERKPHSPDAAIIGSIGLHFQPGGTTVPAAEVSRNSSCPCGSGKKYKKCHGKPS
ncbi:MAG: SEC-C domain-containing protein [Gemmatimonadetes bacterium]|jgi:hypothetical protein|nr:SEC-C domain-containing protein [Gemmatimonadota bacterium]MBA4159877.1 SEC-C domain-containing protein [Gemmatimonadota bacterium]